LLETSPKVAPMQAPEVVMIATAISEAIA